MGMKVGELFAVLKVDKNGFDKGLKDGGLSFGAFKKLLITGALAIAAAFAGITLAAIKTAGDFEDALVKSQAIMGDLSEEMKTTMSDAARDIAKTSTFSAKEAADAYFFLASAGLSAEQSIAALPQVAKFAQAGNFDLALATDLLTDAQSALGLTSKDAATNMTNMTRVSDVFTKANILANTSVEQVSKALTTKAGTAMKLYGIALEDGVAALDVFADKGVKAEAAGNALSAMILGTAQAAVKNKDAFKEYGISIFDAEGNMRSITEITAEFTESLGDMSDKERTAAMRKMGLNKQTGLAIGLLLGETEKLNGYKDALMEAGGVTEEVAAKQLESFNAQMTLLGNVVQDVFISLGMALLPVLKQAVTAIRDWIAANPELIDQFVNGMVDAFMWMADNVIPLLGAAFDFVTKQILPPLIEIIKFVIEDVIPALAAIFTRVSEEVMPGVGSAFDVITQDVLPALGKVFEWIRVNVLPPVQRIFEAWTTNILPLLQKAFEFVQGWIKDNWPLISKVVQQVAAFVKEAFNVIANIIEFVYPIVAKVAEILFPILGAAASVLFQVIERVFTLIGAIWKTASEVADTVVKAIFGSWEGMGKFFEKIWKEVNAVVKGGINFFIGLINGMIGLINNIKIDIPGFDTPVGKIASFKWDGLNLPTIPKLNVGMNFVPETMPAMLHQGEAVLTKTQAEAWRSRNGKGGGGDTFNIYGAQPGDVEREIRRAQRRQALQWQLEGH